MAGLVNGLLGNINAPKYSWDSGAFDTSTVPATSAPMDWAAGMTSARLPTQVGDTASGLSGLNTGDMWASFKDFMLGNQNANGTKSAGAAGTILGALSSFGNAMMANKQLALAKEQFATSKDLAYKNLANQTKTFNMNLEDRQAARVAANPNAYQSVGDYMKINQLG